MALLLGGPALGQIAPSTSYGAAGNSPSMAMSPSLGPPLNNMTARSCVPDRGAPTFSWAEPGAPPPRIPLCSQGGAAAMRLMPNAGPGVTAGR